MKLNILSLTLAFITTQLSALQQPDFKDDDWTFDDYSSDETEVSYRNPRTHGEIAPLLWGKMNSVSLNVDGKRFAWTGMVSERGVIHAWGEGSVRWEEGANLTEMDQKLRKLVDQNFDLFQIKAKELWLSKQRSAYAGPFKTITYQRRLNMGFSEPVAVQRAFVTFRFKWNRLIQITNNSYGKIEKVEAPEVSADDALLAAFEDSRFKEGRDEIISKVKLEVQPFYADNRRLDFRPVYQLSLRKKNPQGLWKYSVSALDGNIVRVVSGLHTSVVGAQLYPRLPSDEMISVPLPFVNVTNGNESEQADEKGEFTFDPESATAELAGAFVRTRRGGGETPKKSSHSSDGIVFSARESIDENMAYFHITQVNQFASRFIKTDFLKRPIIVNTKVVDGDIKSCNAWFDGSNGTLNFLEGDKECQNTAHIADVMYHEWGHALDSALGGIQDDSFSEAVGDITAALMTGDGKMAPGFFKNDPERPIRDLNVLKIYPRDQSRDPHKEGLIIGGAWYETMIALMEKLGSEEGRIKTADLFFRHLVSTDSYLDSYQGMLVIDDDDGDLSNGTPNLCVINPLFAKRGLTSHDPRCRGN